MNRNQNRVKEIVGNAIKDCRMTYTISLRELQEVVISIACDLAIEESRLTPIAADAPPKVITKIADFPMRNAYPKRENAFCGGCGRRHEDTSKRCDFCGYLERR